MSLEVSVKVPFLDLRAVYLELKEELDEAYRRVMQSGWYILGEGVEAFETEWAAFCGARHCVGVGSGLDALHLALRAMGVGPGDEVIGLPKNCIATWLSPTRTPRPSRSNQPSGLTTFIQVG